MQRRRRRKKKQTKKISKSTAYQRGRNFEYRVKKHFEKEGYYVIRKYASKGAEDLVAIKRIRVDYRHYASSVLLIQCKNLAVEKKLSEDERVRLINLSILTGARPLHVFNRNHKLVIEEVV